MKDRCIARDSLSGTVGQKKDYAEQAKARRMHKECLHREGLDEEAEEQKSAD